MELTKPLENNSQLLFNTMQGIRLSYVKPFTGVCLGATASSDSRTLAPVVEKRNAIHWRRWWTTPIRIRRWSELGAIFVLC